MIIHCGLVSSKNHKTSTAAWQNQNAKSPYRDVNIHGRTHVTQMRQGVVSYWQFSQIGATEPKLDIMIPSKLLGPDGRQTGIVKQYWTMEKYAGGTRWGPIVN